jgi:uncharacterized protein (DUF433 family)
VVIAGMWYAELAAHVCRKDRSIMSTQPSSIALAGPNGEALVRKTPGVCGGDACIRETRIMVWLLVAYMRDGVTDESLLENYPSLEPVDLRAAREYYANHKAEIDEAIALNESEDDEEV